MIGDWVLFFSNSDPAACPISSCTLQNGNQDISIGTLSPWNVEVAQNVYTPSSLSLTMTC